MKYNITDAGVLNSIANSDKENLGSELSDIIAYFDYSNHLIIPLLELNESLERLFTGGFLIVLENNNLSATEIYRNWLEKKIGLKSRISIFKMIEDSEKFLNSFNQQKDEKEFDEKIKISESEYSIAVAKYINGFAKS